MLRYSGPKPKITCVRITHYGMHDHAERNIVPSTMREPRVVNSPTIASTPGPAVSTSLF